MAADFALAAAPSVEPDLTVEGFAVALMAMAFAVIGFAIATSMTGSSGNATRRAIRQYERAHSLPADGQIRGRLLTTMGLG